MLRLAPLLLFPLVLTGCDTMPRDAAGATDRIVATGQMRIAVLPDTPDAQPALALLSRYAAAHRARLVPVALHGEHALRWLEDGKIEAVVGHFAKASPWATDIALSKAVGTAEPGDDGQPVLRIARRNGENALVLATDRLIAERAK